MKQIYKNFCFINESKIHILLEFIEIPYRTKKCRTKFSSPMKNFVTFVRRKFCPTKILCNVEISEIFSVTFLIRWAKSKEKKQIYKIFLKLVF